ncbi:MAG: glycosyltransferase [bacterium]
MSIELLLCVILIFYLAQVCFFLYGITHLRDECSSTAQLSVSVIIAARNEEKNIAPCLESVLQQTYSSHSYEVIVADDHSSDSTRSICEAIAKLHPSLTVFLCVDDETLRGKSNALHQAIDRAKNEIILVTDADCTVPSTWIEHTVKRYGPNTGIVGGVTLQKSTDWFGGMQSLDWAYLLGLAASAVALNNPLSTIGNNLSFRKSAYEEVGGYKKIPFSVTEDFMLFQSILQLKKYSCLYPVDSHLTVITNPCSTFAELVRQKQRWGRGGVDMKLSGLAIMVIGFLTHGIIIAGFIAGDILFAATALLIKCIADYSFLHLTLKRLKRIDLLTYFYWFEAYYIVYVILLPFIVFLGGKVKWKGRSY